MHDKVFTAWVFMAVTDAVTELTRRYRMPLMYGEDPEDWVPEDAGVGTDPLRMDDLDDRWIQFYADRINSQIERMLNAEC
jgi:hypothetical protein